MSTPRLLIPQDLVVTGSSSVPIPLPAPSKDPAEMLDYQLDFSQVINRPIVQYDIEITGSTTLQLEYVETDGGTLLTMWLVGGTAGETALLSVSVLSATGQHKLVSLTIPIAIIATFAPSDPAVLQMNGYDLTWGGVSQLVSN